MLGQIDCNAKLLELIDRLPSILIVMLVDDRLEDLSFVKLLAFPFAGGAVELADVGSFEGGVGGHLVEVGVCLVGC